MISAKTKTAIDAPLISGIKSNKCLSPEAGKALLQKFALVFPTVKSARNLEPTCSPVDPGRFDVLRIHSRKPLIMAALTALALGAQPASLAAQPIPRHLSSKADAAGLAYVDCLYATSRKSHGAGDSAAEFERKLAKSCLAEELEFKRHSVPILKFRGDPNPRAKVEMQARELRTGRVVQYRRFPEIERQIREICGADFRFCQD